MSITYTQFNIQEARATALTVSDGLRLLNNGEFIEMRTSKTHPLRIAAVRQTPAHGRIGITFCPGKKDPDAWTGAWHRDLSIDLDAIKDWGATLVVTLVEQHELENLEVPELGKMVHSLGMEWLHLPITDLAIPSSSFETEWRRHGEYIRSLLRNRFDVVVHCKGGLGRSGTIAARILIELGETPTKAIAAVRSARPNAIDQGVQERFVLNITAVPTPTPLSTDEAIKDRAVGALLGLAVGDAVGTTLEFKERDTYEPLTDMVGGGPFDLKPGQWTDDTAMALALADSLNGRDDLDERDLLRRFVKWRAQGTYSCTGECFDIGTTTSHALSQWEKTGKPHSGSTDPKSAGNGSLMRLAPVAIRFWRDRTRLRDIAARQSKTTHAAPEAVDACVAFAELLADAIAGRPVSEVLQVRSNDYAGRIGKIMNGSWRGKQRDDIQASGYVVHTLEAALWCVGRTSDYRSAVLMAANLGEDADTTAAVAGQLAGALYGASKIPNTWANRVAWREKIIGMACKLLAVA